MEIEPLTLFEIIVVIFFISNLIDLMTCVHRVLELYYKNMVPYINVMGSVCWMAGIDHFDTGFVILVNYCRFGW